MIIANLLINNEETLGLIKNNLFYSFDNMDIKAKNLNELIDNYSLEELNKLIKYENGIEYHNFNFLAPITIPKQDVLCLGLNYQKHCEESARFKLEKLEERVEPVYFSKRVNYMNGPYDYIDPHFNIVDSLDYEAELSFIIGKDCYNVKKNDAYDYIFGYTIMNDVSARNIQTKHKQWYLGKSLDTYTPLGPVVVTADVFDPNGVSIKSYVNGELRQDGNTSDFIFPIDFVIENLSEGMTLKKGTIVSTGTPAGVGMGYNPPKFLKSGDVVRCEIEGIGYIENRIK